jgi:ADP-dependent phosphofructokinase/glucokinase
MDNQELKKVWKEKYLTTPKCLEKLKQISKTATAFNTNIDAIYKIKGTQLETLLNEFNINYNEIENITISGFNEPKDIILGITKCFIRGIAEEWVTEDINIYNWLPNNIGYQRLQMGGQGGIIGNTLALLGIKEVIVHTNSHPKLQAEQFLDLDNLVAFDSNGELKKATTITRQNTPLIHWIIEFDKDDTFTLDNKTFTCPKSNRFIATYDPCNMNLVMNKDFVSYLNTTSVDYLLLSGFNPLLEKNNGLKLIDNAVNVISGWKSSNKDMIIHLEVASTQDKVIRKAIIDKIAPLSNSIGLNERETIDLLEVMGQNDLAKKIETKTTSANLFDAILYLKKTLKVERIQLHMFGLYLTIQDKTFKHSPENNINGMITASVVSSSKAYNGEITKYEHLTLASDMLVSDTGLDELSNLANKLNKPELLNTGLCFFDDFAITAIPTILVDKPKTLVGMGDTISSISLLAGA